MRRYQTFILVVLALSVVYLLFIIVNVTVQAAQEATPTEPPLGTSIPVNEPVTGDVPGDLATQVFANAQTAANAAEDAQRYAQDASDEVNKHMDTANNLLGLFQNVTAIVGVLLPVLAVAGGFLGFNQLNEAQRKLEDARNRFEKEMQEKQADLQKVREELERTAESQRETAARANLALSFLQLGERQYRSQDFAGALDTYRRALELDPNSLITQYRLGYVYTQSGNLEQAQHHLTRALEIENNFAPALATLGYVYRRIGEKMPQGTERERTLNKAESLLLEALTISPKLVDEDDESWWGSLAGLYRRRNQIDDAILAYEKAGEITPKSSYAFGNLALLYVQKKDRAAMLRTYQRVEQLAWGEVQADVDNYWAYADLLTARLALGKVKEAEEVLSSVLEIAPADSPYVLESLLDTLRRLESALGETDAAHIRSFIERIEAHVSAKQNNTPSAD
jgi:tetratricopeptide (TPR) repeat protein